MIPIQFILGRVFVQEITDFELFIATDSFYLFDNGFNCD